MVHELSPDNYEKICPLFKEVHLNFIMQSVVKGNQPARIWVDSCENPQTAFVWDKAHCYYFAGFEQNQNFNKAVEKLITETIAPDAVKNGYTYLKVLCTKGWEDKIHRILGRPFVKRDRHMYTFNQSDVNWKSKIPPSSIIEYITEEFLKANRKNTEYVAEEIESMWNSLDDFFANGFGFCSVYHDEIVCWCTAEYVSDTMCGIGIETVRKYQNQGYATVTTSAFVEHCISMNITPHWDCWSDNIPSVKVAEKVGFTNLLQYTAYSGSFNDYESYLIHGDYHCGQKDYMKAAKFYEKALEMKESDWLYYKAACTYALAGKNRNALKNLEKAVDAGFKDINRLREDEDLKRLHKTKEWQELMEKLKNL